MDTVEKPNGQEPQAAPSGTPGNNKEKNGRKRAFNPWILGGIVLVLLVVGIVWYLHSRNYEDTDDAQVDGHLAPIASRVDGTVQAVYVEDNTYVKAGQPLVDLDPKDSEVAVEEAQAKYDQAVAQQQAQDPNVPLTQVNSKTSVEAQALAVTNAEAGLAQAEHDYDNSAAALRQAQANQTRAQADYGRYKILYDKHEVARADYDNYAAIAAQQTAAVEGYQAALAAAGKGIDQKKATLAVERTRLLQNRSNAPRQVAIQQATNRSQAANVEALKASLARAQLNLQYAHIVAPVSGFTTQRSAEVGSRISAGQQLLMIVETDDLWLTANFKETQLARMRVGQPVKIHVDGLDRNFDGTIESMPAITGSRSSVLPPENATGNYVKVVQRMPTRIRFNPGQPGLDQLRPGMSAEPKVHLQ